MSPRVLFILGLPRSFTSVIGAMLGQHPEMYGLPELHLFQYETLSEFLHECTNSSFAMGDGLHRAVAQLVFGDQAEDSVRQANSWIRCRAHLTTGTILEYFAKILSPKIMVEKSPSTVSSREFMHRAYESFPDARFLHLVRHPVGHGQSVLKYLKLHEEAGLISPGHWLLQMACHPNHIGANPRVIDPQHAWYEPNKTIVEFLESVATDRKLLVRGEDMLSEPYASIRRILSWLQLSDDADALERTMHPECSPYACFGPKNAMYGMDYFFLNDPVLRLMQGNPHSLRSPLPWCTDGAGLAPHVVDLAQRFGYE